MTGTGAATGGPGAGGDRLFDLTGKAAVVTGGGGGIGAATALLLARRGARVVVAGLPGDPTEAVAESIRAAGGEALATAADVRVAASVQATADLALAAFKSVDILVNSAGIGGIAAAEATSDELWDGIVATNLTGVFLGCRAVIPIMRRQRGGAIVNVASTTALVGLPGRAAYSAAKAGVVALSRTLAVELAGDGIRVNAVSPGATDTEMVRAGYRAAPDPDAARRRHAANQPIGRLSAPGEIAAAVLYLVSDQAATVTGTNLVVDGGFTAGGSDWTT
jgi:NAD(P)-dependent dehydrogenase (short-subunit alcohol dehydrogenase family)